jgi:tetraacyldisaccharide 4'-kinase
MARAKPYRARARVLCVGNLTAGGSGKTPIGIALGLMLAARGKKIAFLTRGYGGKLYGPLQVDAARHSAADVGDEALLLAAKAPTIVARDRAAGAKLADSLKTDIIVMDDGFQNFQLAKDVSLIVIDAEFGLGNRRLIPAGPLREGPEDGFARADALVLMGDGQPSLPPFAGSVFRARMLPSASAALAGRAVFAFAGIGRPEKFFQTLRRIGARVLGTRTLPDHHRYTSIELAALRVLAESFAALLVTTEKDFVRIAEPDRRAILPVPVHAVFEEDPDLSALLDRLVAARA